MIEKVQQGIDTRAIDFLIKYGENFSNVHHGKKVGIDLFSYATGHGFEEKALELVDAFGNFELSKSFEKMTPFELYEELGDKLDIFYQVVQKSLDNGWEFGFHRHDKEHSRVVTDRILEIMKILGCSDEDAKLAIICGRIHDLGQIFSRKEHPEYSVKIFEKLFGNYLNEEQMRKVSDAISNHEKGSAKRKFEDELGFCRGDFDKTYEKLGRQNPLLWALVLADKSDIGRDRVSVKALGRYSEAVEGDKHIRKDALVEYEGLIEDGHRIIYNRGRFRDEFGEEMSFDQWKDLFLNLQGERLALSAVSYFALNLDKNRFVVRLENGENEGENYQIVFERNKNPFNNKIGE